MKKAVFVLEPNKDMKDLVGHWLERLDFSPILYSKSGEAALNAIAKIGVRIGIIITSREMLGVPVRTILQKAREENPEVGKIVLTTSSRFEDVAEELEDMAPFSVMCPPPDFETFKTLILPLRDRL